MLKLPQRVEVKWCSKNKVHFIEKGYNFTKMKDSFEANVEDLTDGSKCKIFYICDYCGEEFETTYNTYIVKRKRSIIKKDCCLKCRIFKMEESNLLKYGVKNSNKLESVKEKRKTTNIDKYGVEYPIQCPEIKAKMIKTNLEKYGTECVLGNKEIRDKVNETNFKKYNTKYPIQNEKVKEKALNVLYDKYGGIGNGSKLILNKVKKTNMNKYGVNTVLQLETVREKANKMLIVKKKHKSSKQQEYILKVCGGVLNYPIGRYSLDIAFPEDKIYIEYDGSGHDLCVKMGKMTSGKFNEKEKNRSNFLYKKGWKELRLVSLNDKLPLESELKDIINININKLKETKALRKIKINLNKLENINLYRVKGEKV